MIKSWFDKILRLSIAAGIGGYQRYLSPYKGFSCAHRRLYGGESCSQFAKQKVLTEGAVVAWRELGFRLRECKEANRILKARRGASLAAVVSSKVSEELGNFPEDPRYPRRPPKRPERRTCYDEACSSCDIFSDSGNCDSCNILEDSNGFDCNPFDGDGCSFDCNPFDGGVGDCGDCSGLDCGSS